MIFTRALSAATSLTAFCTGAAGAGRANLIALYGAMAALPDVLRQLAHNRPRRSAIGNYTCRTYV